MNEKKNGRAEEVRKQDHGYTVNVDSIYPPAPVVHGPFDITSQFEIEDTDLSDINWYDGKIGVELKDVADQMYCTKCKFPLHLHDIICERQLGLDSVFSIQCIKILCAFIVRKTNLKGAFDVNTNVAIGE